MSRSYIKAEARRLIIRELERLIAGRSEMAGAVEKDVTHEIDRLRDRLQKDVRSLVRNRDYAVKGQAQ